jgi:HPt (histidine-containing phosphotransfer) domain-containing protein
MDGIETVQEIRKLGGKYESLTIVALTANAVMGAREMFLENSFNDFLSKPINSYELLIIVKKYLPEDAVKTVTATNNRTNALNKEEQLRRKSINTFVKENLHTYEKMRDALDSQDYKTAHRIAHTLKSSAGYLGEKALQAASLSLEMSLQGDPPAYTPEQMETFENELATALRGFEIIVQEMEAEKKHEKAEAVEMGEDELAAILAELRPLLVKSDFEAVNLIEKLQGIKGMEELAERVDDYDFNGALAILDSLEHK